MKLCLRFQVSLCILKVMFSVFYDVLFYFDGVTYHLVADTSLPASVCLLLLWFPPLHSCVAPVSHCFLPLRELSLCLHFPKCRLSLSLASPVGLALSWLIPRVPNLLVRLKFCFFGLLYPSVSRVFVLVGSLVVTQNKTKNWFMNEKIPLNLFSEMLLTQKCEQLLKSEERIGNDLIMNC